MVVNFKIHKINQDSHKLTQISTFYIYIYIYIYIYRIFQKDCALSHRIGCTAGSHCISTVNFHFNPFVILFSKILFEILYPYRSRLTLSFRCLVGIVNIDPYFIRRDDPFQKRNEKVGSWTPGIRKKKSMKRFVYWSFFFLSLRCLWITLMRTTTEIFYFYFLI